MFEWLLATGFASEILEKTSSTPDTLRALELSLAPAFLLVGIGSIMNVMVTRLNWIAGRIERLSEQGEHDRTANLNRELTWLRRRRQLARRAIMLATAAAVVISVVIAVLFVSIYIETKIGTAVAFLWVTTMGLLISALFHFSRETLLAAGGPEKQKQ